MKEKLLEMIFAMIDLNKLDMLETQSEETRNECRKHIAECERLLADIYIN